MLPTWRLLLYCPSQNLAKDSVLLLSGPSINQVGLSQTPSPHKDFDGGRFNLVIMLATRVKLTSLENDQLEGCVVIRDSSNLFQRPPTVDTIRRSISHPTAFVGLPIGVKVCPPTCGHA